MADSKNQEKVPKILKNSNVAYKIISVDLDKNNATGDDGSILIPEEENEIRTIKVLTEKLSELESHCEQLSFQNEKLNLELEHEKNKVSHLNRQLQFVKDNQGIFEKMRQAYINMKYNEANGKKIVEIRDKSVQTWDGILCRACLDTEKIRMELEQLKTNGGFLIETTEMDKIESTVQLLKTYLYTNNEKHA